MGYIYILGTILFTVFGQLIAKWRMTYHGPLLPDGLLNKINYFFFKMMFDPYIIATFACAFIASFLWLMTVNKFELSFAYPFMALAFVLVVAAAVPLFNETLNIYKISGTLLVVVGLIVLSKGHA